MAGLDQAMTVVVLAPPCPPDHSRRAPPLRHGRPEAEAAPRRL